MKTKKNVLQVLIALVFMVTFMLTFIAANKPAADFKYIGVDKCAAMCHKGDSKGRQLEIWKDSKHANAFKTLQTSGADAIAKEKGFDTPAAETPECVKCHTLGKAFTGLQFEDSFDKTQGVQCETCHGAGSEYKKLTIMKDRNLAIQNGLTVHENDKDTFCRTCHNPESPTFKEFNLDEYWSKIQHPKP